MPRKTPRPKEQARAIARALRARYISPEAEQAARQAMANVAAQPAKPVVADPMMDLIRAREGIAASVPKDERPFTEAERDQARTVLDAFLKRARPH